MSAHQVRLELLVGNHSVADATTGLAMRSPAALPARLRPRTAGATLGQVSSALSFRPAVDGIVIPPAWQQALQQREDEIPATWWVDRQRRWVRQTAVGQGPTWYGVKTDGSMRYQEEAPALPPGEVLGPACVVYTAKGGPRKQPQQRQGDAREAPATSAYYLVGAWQEVTLDPSVWGFGPGLDLLKYTVRAATQRLLQFACRPLPGWVPDMGMRPRVWRSKDGSLSPATALQQLEGRQKRSFDSMMQRGFAAPGRFAAADVAAGVHANWMDPSPPRLHPRQRAAAGQAAAPAGPLTAQRQRQELLQVSEPVVDDTEDPLTRGLEPALPDDDLWTAAYRRASDKRLPRRLRVLGWKLLHAAVHVGGSRFHAARSRQDLLQCCCLRPDCHQRQPQPDQEQGQRDPSQLGQQQQQQQQQLPPQQEQQQEQRRQSQPGQQQWEQRGQPQPGQQPGPPQGRPQPQQQLGSQLPQPGTYTLETLSHVFVFCGPALDAWSWFERMWDRIEPGSVSARALDCHDAGLILLDDVREWQPPAALVHLWTHLRLLMLQSVWDARCDSQGQQYSGSQVVSRFVAVLQQQLRQDWARTQDDIRVDSGVPMSWLRF